MQNTDLFGKYLYLIDFSKPRNMLIRNYSFTDLLAEVDSLSEAFDIEDNPIAEQIVKHDKTCPNSNKITNQLPSVFESDDSGLEEMLDDILERGRNLLKKPKGPLVVYTGSCALDSRLEIGVETLSEITLRRLIVLSSHNLSQNVCLTFPNEESDNPLPPWPQNLRVPWLIRSYSNKQSLDMLDVCFDYLFNEIRMYSPTNIEHILQLWLTLNCPPSDEKFNPSIVPYIGLNPGAICNLISAIAWCPGLSLRTWCCTLQTLTLVCNQANSGTDWSGHFGMYAMTSHLIDHPDFVQLLLRLLSGTGVVFLDKGLAGPSVCKALHDLLVRLQMRCDVVSVNSEPGNKLKGLLLKVVYQLVQPTGPLAARQGPLDAQCKFLQCMLYLDFTNADLSMVMSILESTG